MKLLCSEYVMAHYRSNMRWERQEPSELCCHPSNPLIAASIWTVATPSASPRAQDSNAGQLRRQWVRRANCFSTRSRGRVIHLVTKGPARLCCVELLRCSVAVRLRSGGSERDVPPIAFADLKFLSAGSLGFVPAQKN